MTEKTTTLAFLAVVAHSSFGAFGAVGITVVAAAAGCVEASTAGSHVKAGDLYAPGQERYDDYFAAVHSQQASAAQWAADRKAAHQTIVSALKLDGDATDAAIGKAAHAKPTQSKTVALAVEQTVHADTERAKGLEAMASKIDELVKTGHLLEEHVSEDFGKPGSGQSAPAPSDVKMELHASFEVLDGLRERAKTEAKAAQDFLALLQQHGSAGAGASKHGSSPSKTAQAPASAPAGASSAPAATPAPKPAPKTDPGEVFQP